jgi:hypothetical protein
MRINLSGGGHGIGGRVGTDGCRWLGLLLFLVLFAEAAFGGRVDGPRHVVHTPMVSVLSNFLGMFLSILGRHLLPCFALFLTDLVRCVLLVLLRLSSLFLLVNELAELIIKLEVAFESTDGGQHGHDLLVVGQLGTPLAFHFQVVILAHGASHEVLVGDRGEFAVKVVLVLALDVLLEVVAGSD